MCECVAAVALEGVTAVAIVRRRCATASVCSAEVAVAMRRRCSSASATLHSVEALPLVLDCKQLCDSRTMQRGINYLQRARPHEQLSTGKVDLTHDGVHLGYLRVLFFRAHADGSVPDKPAASPPRHMGALDERTGSRPRAVVVARGGAPSTRPRVRAPASEARDPPLNRGQPSKHRPRHRCSVREGTAPTAE